MQSTPNNTFEYLLSFPYYSKLQVTFDGPGDQFLLYLTGCGRLLEENQGGSQLIQVYPFLANGLSK